MDGDVTGEAVQPFGQPDEHVQLLGALNLCRNFGQLWFLFQRGAEVAGVEPPQLFRDRTDVGIRNAEGAAGIADGTAGPVRVGHRHEGYPFGPEGAKQFPVDVVPAVGFHIDVNIGQGLPFGGEEPFPDQVVADRFNDGGVQGIVQHRADTGSAGLNPNPHVPHQIACFGDGEEVTGEPELVNGRHLMRQRGVRLSQERGVGVPFVDTVAGARPQFGVRIPGDADDRRLRHPGTTQPDVSHRIEGAPIRQGGSVCQESGEGAGGMGADVDHHPPHLAHQGVRFQPRLPVRLRCFKLGQRCQRAGGVGEVCGDRLAGGSVPDRVGQNCGKHRPLGQAQHPGCRPHTAWP